MELQFSSIHLRIKNRDIFQKYLLRYIIESRSKQLIETYDPTLNLSSLSAGNYTIRVSCNTKDGNHTTPQKLINIIVTPPWYKTSWFIGIAAILFIITTARYRLHLFPTEREIYERQYEPLPTSYIERHLKKQRRKKYQSKKTFLQRNYHLIG